MSWTDFFNRCMSDSGLPTPGELFNSAEEALDILHQLRTAWEASGGTDELTLQDLLVAATAAGISAAALEVLTEIVAVAATLTASAYLGACVGCVFSATYDVAIQALKDLVSSADDPWVKGKLVAQAESQGIQNIA